MASTKKQIAANFTDADIKAIEVMEVTAAKETAHALLDNAAKHPKYPMATAKVSVLKRNVDAAKDTVHVAWVFYNMLLSGEGLGVIGSNYSRKYA